MIAYGENIKIFCGNSNPAFAQTVCKELGLAIGNGEVKTFADGEVAEYGDKNDVFPKIMDVRMGCRYARKS